MTFWLEWLSVFERGNRESTYRDTCVLGYVDVYGRWVFTCGNDDGDDGWRGACGCGDGGCDDERRPSWLNQRRMLLRWPLFLLDITILFRRGE